MKYVIITGCLGFIGSSFTKHFLKKNKKFNVIGIDKLTYAANNKKLSDFKKNKKFKFFKIDIYDYKKLQKIFNNFEIYHVINLAAETHVDASILEPDIFIKSNILGTYNLLKLSKKKWIDNKNIKYKKSSFLQVSTDEVYGSIKKGKFYENSPFKPNSPYSSSKAASDLLVRSFNKTYKLNTIITNSSNNFGPDQNVEKLIPTIINKLINKKSIPIYGDGSNIRNWLYVDENCEALYNVFLKGKYGQNYNIGSNIEFTNYNLAKKICILFKSIKKSNYNYTKLIKFVKDRPGHDFRYSLSIKKIKNHCNWNPTDNFSSHIKKTILGVLNKK